ncbi:DUF4239 domain-containing protein [Bailinhaonella thermotolerans]|uniref:DUF4239 domain-containing protein n=1 Tax=Bailinhaonella thermotolerans TaxID=1070861 RepID=A0A3A4B8R2_9ACTN|nr:DUF4239 domain-containing protein [Bailinhaonella thermotolerans]RJL34074.1 DUF4239 domain-containing protein [Bailinhaonella thermotolerans]
MPALLIVAAAAAVAGVSAVLLHRHVPAGVRARFRETGIVVTCLAGALFAITVGLAVVSAWERLDRAGEEVAAEADSAVDIFWYSRTLPAGQRGLMQRHLREYLAVVLYKEWAMMERSRAVSAEGWTLTDRLREGLQSVQPRTRGEVARYGQAMSRMHELLDARRARAARAAGGESPLLWAALAAAATAVIVPAVVFAADRLVVRVAAPAALAATVAAGLLLVHHLATPYAGPVRVSPDPFHLGLARVTEIAQLPPLT